jgi:membrane associated rhomboid family serine protease
MRICPRCKDDLGDVRDEHGVGAACATCGGRMVTFDDLGTALPPDTAAAFEHALRSAEDVGRRPCPACSTAMREIPAGGYGPPVVVAGCPACRLAWFDADGVERLSPRPPRRARRGRMGPGDVAEVLAMANLARGRDSDVTRGIDMWSREGAAGYLGLPTIHDAPRTRTITWVTYGLVGALFAVPIAAWVIALFTYGLSASFDALHVLIDEGGFVPDDPWRQGGATWITSTFVHGGPIHLLVNAWALYVVGRVVEARLGDLRLLALFLLAAVAGNLLELGVNATSDVPRVGASGGISGLFAWCALAVPKLKLGVYFANYRDWRSYTFTRVLVPVRWMFGFWLVLQVLGALGAAPGVAIASHFGGALLGVGWWLVRRRVEEPIPTAPAVLPLLRPKPDRTFPSAVPVVPVGEPAGASSSPIPDAAPSASGFDLAPEPVRRSSAVTMDVAVASDAAVSTPVAPPPPEPTMALPSTLNPPSPAPPRGAVKGYEWTMAEGVRDLTRSLLRRSVAASVPWAVLSAGILGACGALFQIAGNSGFSQLTFLVAFVSFFAGYPTGLLFGRGLVEEVGFEGWEPVGMAVGASLAVVLGIGLIVGALLPGAGDLHRTVVILFGAGGAVTAAIRKTWAAT